MKVLDLFCGYGGFSDGFSAAGFDILGIDNEHSIIDWYDYPLVIQDIRTIAGERLTGQFDVIVASPPCQEMSTARRPRILEPDMSCFNAVKDIVARAKPRFWIMENVRGAITHIGAPTFRFFPWYLWGNFPSFLKRMERAPGKGTKKGGTRFIRDPRRVAMIPLEISVPLAEACRDSLVNTE